MEKASSRDQAKYTILSKNVIHLKFSLEILPQEVDSVLDS